ncbi:hypothetical protein [Hymenobacter nivis]|uniref:Uncharacterized protein n=1 Tax=Hymenobacter nivis TaxID=1850093 RepID=A0A502H225_9BACT|nr:hypothetical protein [Hymenobacter nivis]TPG67416.1 hypothetical protein EAH73_06750 [Hymenobacter nivis]
MSTSSKKPTDNENTPPVPVEGDPLFTLHFAQAEAALKEKNGGLGPTSNQYVSNDEEENIDEALTPRDSQGFVRGEEDPDRTGSNAGGHS